MTDHPRAGNLVRIDSTADFPHGTPSGSRRGCRCFACRLAASQYLRDWRSRPTPARVDAAPLTAWLRHLKAKGVGLRRVAQLSGVALRTVQAIRLGRLTCIHARTAAKLRAIQPSLAPGQVVRSYHTRQLIGALLSEGYTKRTLARRLGLHSPQVRIDPETCRVRTALKVRVLHQRLMGDESG